MIRRLARQARGDNGQVIVIAALMIPVFLLLGALVVDAGNWYAHKRSLQNRADAGALAAGLEYTKNNNLRNCISNPGGTGTTLSNLAKAYAGTNDVSVGTTYNKNVNNQSNVTVAINATNPTALDWTDGGSPCAPHAADGWSSAGLWTDVKVREGNVGTLFGSFGISLPQIAAQARVKVQPIIGVGTNGLPFIAETGDQIECVWAQFVRARDGGTTGFTVTPSNPILLTEGTNHTWTGNVTNVVFTNAHDDVAVRYWGGSKNGSAPCDFANGPKKPLPHELGQDNLPVQIDWLNVYDTGAQPGNQQAPKLRRFSLSANTCGGPGYLYTTDTSAGATCRVDFTAEVDTGVNNVRGEITAQPVGTAVSPVTIPYDTTGAGSNLATVSGTIIVFPNHTASGSNIQNYDQVGPTYLKVSWRQVTGQVGSTNCATGNCSGTFEGETVSGVSDDIQQQFYTSDPLASVPLVATSVTPAAGRSFPALGSTGPFSVTFQHTAVDKDHVVLIRDSGSFGPGTGNRTRSIYCGNSPGQGAQALENAIKDGCAKDLALNARQDSCSPAPLSSANPWDCVQLEQGQKTSVSKGAEDRFQCTPNNWPNPPETDQRYAYIILTGFGRTGGAANGDWLPIEGLLRVYVTGWDRSGGGGGPANCSYNDDPPRGYDTQGAQIWGHLVEPITIDPAVIVGDGECDLTNDNIQCSPRLVR